MNDLAYICFVIIWVLCGLLSFRIMMRLYMEQEQIEQYRFEPGHIIILLNYIFAGLGGLLLSLIVWLVEKKSTILKKLLSFIIG